MFHGRDNLDEKISRHVGIEGGFFFEAGANDGRAQSNSLYFEESRNWRGILVEPHPERFFECAANRPKAYVEWGALVPPDWNQDYVELTYCNLMTVTKGSWDDPRAEHDHIQQGMQYLRKEDRTIYEFRSRPLTISGVLDKFRVTHVDLMTIDLEGFELPALRGMDMTRHRPTWLVVEERQPDRLKSFLAPYYSFVDQLSDVDFLYSLQMTVDACTKASRLGGATILRRVCGTASFRPATTRDRTLGRSAGRRGPRPARGSSLSCGRHRHFAQEASGRR